MTAIVLFVTCGIYLKALHTWPERILRSFKIITTVQPPRYNDDYQLMGIFCDRLKFSSTAALHSRTGQNKGRTCKKQLLVLLVSFVETAQVEITLLGEHLYFSTQFNLGTASWLAELRNLLTLDAFARPSNRMLPIPKDNVRDKSFSLESWKENKKYIKNFSGIGKESCSRL